MNLIENTTILADRIKNNNLTEGHASKRIIDEKLLRQLLGPEYNVFSNYVQTIFFEKKNK